MTGLESLFLRSAAGKPKPRIVALADGPYLGWPKVGPRVLTGQHVRFLQPTRSLFFCAFLPRHQVT
jgi:hypothetical protein